MKETATTKHSIPAPLASVHQGDASVPVVRVLAKLEGVTRTAGGWLARCPAHDDRNASLSVGEGRDGRALVFCHAGCRTADIMAAIGFTMRDLFIASRARRWRSDG
jgi:hypothetical protein